MGEILCSGKAALAFSLSYMYKHFASDFAPGSLNKSLPEIKAFGGFPVPRSPLPIAMAIVSSALLTLPTIVLHNGLGYTYSPVLDQHLTTSLHRSSAYVVAL